VSGKAFQVFTVGHSTHTAEKFLELLVSQSIRALADVRRFPGSRRHPQFGQEQLSALLATRRIEYLHFPELGGRRKARADSRNTAWRVETFRGYADYMETQDFAAGMERLVSLALSRRTCMMCAESLWWQCHRGLISDWLKVSGVEVLHILANGKIEEHPFTSACRIINGRLSYEAEPESPSQTSFL
jgi:uncharacterized protein (DUF488 family)